MYSWNGCVNGLRHHLTFNRNRFYPGKSVFYLYICFGGPCLMTMATTEVWGKFMEIQTDDPKNI